MGKYISVTAGAGCMVGYDDGDDTRALTEWEVEEVCKTMNDKTNVRSLPMLGEAATTESVWGGFVLPNGTRYIPIPNEDYIDSTALCIDDGDGGYYWVVRAKNDAVSA